MGFGLGASGALTHVAAQLEGTIAPARAQSSAYFSGYPEAGRVWAQWVMIEMVGVVVGDFLGAWSAGRLQWRLDKGAQIGWGRRLGFTFVGGATVGFASRVAQGCTSGLALSESALLSPGAWAFTLAFLGGGFVTAWIVRRVWQ